jgi:hypothetical protein
MHRTRLVRWGAFFCPANSVRAQAGTAGAAVEGRPLFGEVAEAQM